MWAQLFEIVYWHVMVHLDEHSAQRNARKFVSMVCHNIANALGALLSMLIDSAIQQGNAVCCQEVCNNLRSCKMSVTLDTEIIKWRASPITSGGSDYS